MRLIESLLGGLIAAVVTKSLVIAAVVVFLLYLAWENGRYGYLARIDNDESESEEGHVLEQEEERDDA